MDTVLLIKGFALETGKLFFHIFHEKNFLFFLPLLAFFPLIYVQN